MENLVKGERKSSPISGILLLTSNPPPRRKKRQKISDEELFAVKKIQKRVLLLKNSFYFFLENLSVESQCQVVEASFKYINMEKSIFSLKVNLRHMNPSNLFKEDFKLEPSWIQRILFGNFFKPRIFLLQRFNQFSFVLNIQIIVVVQLRTKLLNIPSKEIDEVPFVVSGNGKEIHFQTFLLTNC
jgi:hypothetical protein